MTSQDPNQINFKAYEKDLEFLLKKHRGQFVAYHEGSRLAIEQTGELAYERAREIIPRGVVLVTKIEKEFSNFKMRTPSYGRIRK